jgi:hypothetical protein
MVGVAVGLSVGVSDGVNVNVLVGVRVMVGVRVRVGVSVTVAVGMTPSVGRLVRASANASSCGDGSLKRTATKPIIARVARVNSTATAL